MNIAKTRLEMMACVEALRQRLADEPDPARRLRLVHATRRAVHRLRKRFKRTIDERAASFGGFAINEREGIERKLAEAAAAAMTAIDETAGGAS
jgi:hypothetical protein